MSHFQESIYPLTPKFIETSCPNNLTYKLGFAAAAMNNSQTISNRFAVHSSKSYVCAICGDKASGKHYGVASCEGCKGFFKRTVRKDLTYTCRDLSKCVVDKRQRNRCQYCRYHKCLSNGMKREAVQEERQKYQQQLKNDLDRYSPTSNEYKEEEQDTLDELNDDLVMTPDEKTLLEQIICSEDSFNPKIKISDPNPCSVEALYESIEQQLGRIPQWAKSIEQMKELEIDDQVSLLRANWREILCISLAHRSIICENTLLLATGSLFTAEKLSDVTLQSLVHLLISDIVNRIKELDIDRIELAFLKLLLLFDSDAKNLKNAKKVNDIRDSVCLMLSKYCRRDQFVNDPCRFARLLMCLPPIRSWTLKGTENIMSIKATNQFDSILVEAFVKIPKKF